jgi:hypothetical protein
MRNIFRIVQGAAAAAGMSAVAGGAMAATPTVNCDTPGQTITAAIAALSPATYYQTINVSGKCKENIYIPPELAVTLVAPTGARLTPATTSSATIDVEGRLIVENMTINTGTFAGFYVNRGGFGTLIAGTIDGAGAGVQVSDNSGALLQDTTIKVTGGTGVSLYSNGSLEVDGVAGLFGRNAASIASVASGGIGIFCGQGNVTLSTKGGGDISLKENGFAGISAIGCNVKVNASAANPVTIDRTGASGKNSDGIVLQGGSATLNGVRIIQNLGNGLDAYENASVALQGDGLEIEGNLGAGILAAQGASVHIVPYNGVNTISQGGNDANPLFDCYQGGNIYVDQIAGTITPAPTKATLGCLTVGTPQ